LITDDWDDWFRFSTMYNLIVINNSGERHDVGRVKIGEFGMSEDQRRPDIPQSFTALGPRFFSLGQDDSYYANLNELGSDVRDGILTALRDLAIANPEALERALQEKVTEVSLLRSVSESTVRGQFYRMARGQARLTSYRFSYESMPTNIGPSLVLSFEVEPESDPPTNIHVLIGRNAVGKTFLMNRLVRAVVSVDEGGEHGRLNTDDIFGHTAFAGLVSVSFSAFDFFEPPPTVSRNDEVRYEYVGLQRLGDGVDEQEPGPKTAMELAEEVINSIHRFKKGARLLRWQRALASLEADPMFKEADIRAVVGDATDPGWDSRSFDVVRRLSSGHKIVLLTVTRLVETVEERTLVLLDEPEAHLHPPLLSAFVRALSELLIDRNGVAIIATHSPVILQEVPKRCVWKLRRNGAEVRAERPEIETFGENVGILTREVFGLEVTQSGFHKMLREAVEEERTYEAVLQRFGNELGAEARAIVRGLVAEQDA
jgi:hypothetical protein